MKIPQRRTSDHPHHLEGKAVLVVKEGMVEIGEGIVVKEEMAGIGEEKVEIEGEMVVLAVVKEEMAETEGEMVAVKEEKVVLVVKEEMRETEGEMGVLVVKEEMRETEGEMGVLVVKEEMRETGDEMGVLVVKEEMRETGDEMGVLVVKEEMRETGDEMGVLVVKEEMRETGDEMGVLVVKEEMRETGDEIVEIEGEMVVIKEEMMEIEGEMAETGEEKVAVKEEIQIKREANLEEDNQSFFWIRSEGQKKLATENMVPGNEVYKEKLIIKKGIEYRLWDPFRSKLAASIINGLDYFPFENKSKILYLGASTGTTVSHISDIVGPNGIVFGVEHASRVARDFLDRVVSYRKNIIPILQDARRPKEYFSVFGKVDVVYVDIAQPDQTKIAIDNCQMYLKKSGYFFLVIKTRSIDVTKAPKRIVDGEVEKLKPKFDVLQIIDLHPYDKDHAMVIAKFKD